MPIVTARSLRGLALAILAWSAAALPAGAQVPEDTPREPTVAELVRLIEGQRSLLEEQQRRLVAQEERIGALEQRISGTLEPPSVSGLPAAAAAGMHEMEKTPSLEVKDIAAEFPGAFKVPGSDAGLRIGGLVRMVDVHNIGPIGSDDRFVTSSIPMEGSEDAEKGSRTTYTVDASRLNFDMRTPSGVGHLRAFVEADFAGTGRAFRLRHAYGQWRKLIIGQTWSTFSDPEAEPDGIDFEGLNAISLFRQPQVRWTHGLGERFALSLALENPNPDLTGAAGVNMVPDFVGRVRWEPGDKPFGPLGFLRSGAHVQAAVLVRQLRGAPPDRPNDPVGTGALGFNVSGRVAVRRSADRDYITFAANAGHGIGRYVSDLGTLGGQDAVYDAATNSLVPLSVASGYVGYQHWWTDSVRSTVTWGGVWVETLDIQAPDSLQRTQRATLNLSWSPIGRIDLVGEFLWGRRVDKDGQRGTATQYQLGSIFRF
jgi:outer membrane DcaP-like protein